MELKKSSMMRSVFMAIFACFALFTFSACGFPLKAPVIERAGATISWANTGAYRYQVVLDEETFETDGLQFDMMPYLDAGTHSVKVKSLARPGSFLKEDSSFSEVVEFEAEDDISTPTNLVIEEGLTAVTLTFDPVLDALSYTVRIEKEESETQFIPTVNESVRIESYLTKAGTYNISVRAEAFDEFTIQVSPYSGSVECINSVALKAPQTKSFVKSGSAYNLSWEPVDFATGYVVSVLGSDKTIETSNTSADLSSIEGGLPSQGYQIAFVQAVAEGLYKTSDFSDGIICYGNNSSRAQFSGLEVDFFKSNLTGATTFDFSVGSQEELDDLIYFAILYRIGKIDFYFENPFGVGDINTKASKISSAINKFPEIMALSRGVSTAGERVTLTMEFYNPSTPSLEAEGDTTVTQVSMTDGKLNSFGAGLRAEDFNDFAIFEREKGINVYTSEQLFQVVEAGYKPILIDNSPAKLVWDIACSILIDIIDDTMTDYQKTLAIFEWICYNNTYDYNAMNNVGELEEEQAELKSKYSTNESYWTDTAKEARYDEITYIIRDHKAFYIEGMLLDSGVAVCDGIAKTFALFCNIEDIECYKVNGMAGGAGQSGGHAWNKVALDLDGDNNSEWYTVDCTWNDPTYYYTQYDRYELMTHSYFLLTDESITGTHDEEAPDKDVSETVFDYHTFTTFDIEGTEFDLYVNEASEIETLLDFLKDNFEYFEIKVDKDLDSTVVSNLSGYVCMAVEETADYYVVVVYK